MMQPPKKYHLFDYVVLQELPIDQQSSLRKWIIGKTLIKVEPESPEAICIYYHDYTRWYNEWIKETDK